MRIGSLAGDDADGTHRFSFARRGAGPDELSQPCCLAFAPDGLLWVRDNGNARYVAFEVGDDIATPVATRRMEHSDANRHVTTTFDEAGTPQQHPPIAALRFDEASGLWAQRTTLPGVPRQVDVHARNGALVEQVEFPAGLDPSYGVLKPDALVGVIRDELDVEYVVRLEVR